MRKSSSGLLGSILVAFTALLASSCGGAGGESDWYYHFSCNGDAQCLATNPTGQPSGSLNEGPTASNCTQLLEFAARFWGPAAFNSCDHSPAFPFLLTSIMVSPANSRLPIGLTEQFTATGRYADGTSRDLTSQVAWTAATTAGGPGVATIAAGGLATAVAQGTATIAAALGTVSGSTALSVGPVALVTVAVAPADPTIAKGQRQAFTATGHYSDGSAKNITAGAFWASATPAVATIDATGSAAGVKSGSAVISATSNGIVGTTTLTVTGPVLVSMAVLPASPTVARTFSRALHAIGTYSDGSSLDVTGSVTWTSGTLGVATIASSGIATGVAAGTSVVTAASGTVSGQTTLTVTNASLLSVAVTPGLPSVAPAATVAFTATGHFSDGTTQALTAGVTWTSTTTSVATVAPSGLATAIAVGTSAVKATSGTISGSATLTVTPTPPGVTWTYTGGSTPLANGWLWSAVSSGTQFVVGSTAGSTAGLILTSPDGVTWTPRYPGAGPPSWAFGLAWAPELGRFVAVGPAGILSSSDGITWAVYSPGNITRLLGVTWSGSQFVVVGDAGTILTSPDGLAWTVQPSGTTAILRSVVWSGFQFVAVGDVLSVSPDGTKWTTTVEPSGGWTGVTWSGSQFIRVSQTGSIQASSDGVTWIDRASVGTPLYGVIWADTQFVAAGGDLGAGYVATSLDGVTWTSRTLGTAGTPTGSSTQLRGVAWSGTRFVAVAAYGYIWMSQ